MQPIYMRDEDYFRLINFMMDSFLGELLKGQRDLVMTALGEKAGIWPEFSRPADERVIA